MFIRRVYIYIEVTYNIDIRLRYSFKYPLELVVDIDQIFVRRAVNNTYGYIMSSRVIVILINIVS